MRREGSDITGSDNVAEEREKSSKKELKLEPLNAKELENIRKSNERLRKRLKARSKPLHELVVSEVFRVEEVIVNSYQTRISPISEYTPIGERIPSYEGGLTSIVRLLVKPEDHKNISVIELIFRGVSTVKKYDLVEAKIPRFEEYIERKGYPKPFRAGDRIAEALIDLEKISRTRIHRETRHFYVDRKYKKRETSIEISIFGPGRDILRLERAVDYDIYQKKKNVFVSY